MTGRLLFLTVGVIGVLATAQEPVPVSVSPVDVVNVRSLGARGDGETDDTAAFLDAITEARERLVNVYVPRGEYVISQPLVLEEISLTGPEGLAWPADRNVLPAILPLHRDGPAFHLWDGAGLRGVDITYNWTEEPEAGPPAVLVSGVGVYISNMRIRYAWDGILTDGAHNVGRVNFENIFMVAIRNVGVRVTGTWDVPRLHNIEVWNAGPVPRGLEQGIGFHLGKNDLIRVTDCFAFAMQTGFLLEEEIEGLEIEGGTWGVMNGCSTDFCGNGVVVRGAHTLSFSGGTLWDHHVGLLVEGEGARVRMSGTEIKSNGAPAVVVRGGDHTVVTGCTLSRTMEGHQAPTVVLERGRTVVTGNHIESRGDAVTVGPLVLGAVVQGNAISPRDGQALVVSEGTVPEYVVVGGNAVLPPLEEVVPAAAEEDAPASEVE